VKELLKLTHISEVITKVKVASFCTAVLLRTKIKIELRLTVIAGYATSQHLTVIVYT